MKRLLKLPSPKIASPGIKKFKLEKMKDKWATQKPLKVLEVKENNPKSKRVEELNKSVEALKKLGLKVDQSQCDMTFKEVEKRKSRRA